MANITPIPPYGNVSYSAAQCIQTHVATPIVYNITAFDNANRNTTGSVNIAALNTTITPRLLTSKIMITLSLCYEHLWYGAWYLVRNIGGTRTEIGSAPNTGNNQPYGFASPRYNDNSYIFTIQDSRSYVDTPNTLSPVTYEMWAYSTSHNSNTNNKFCLNRTFNDGDNAWTGRGTSQMILQEFFK
jgi:hypothetical protein